MIRNDYGKEYALYHSYEYEECTPELQKKIREAMGESYEGSRIRFADLGAVIFNNDEDFEVFWLENPPGCDLRYYDDTSQYYRGADYECYVADPEQREFVPYEEAYAYPWDFLMRWYDNREDSVEEYLNNAQGLTVDEWDTKRGQCQSI